MMRVVVVVDVTRVVVVVGARVMRVVLVVLVEGARVVVVGANVTRVVVVVGATTIRVVLVVLVDVVRVVVLVVWRTVVDELAVVVDVVVVLHDHGGRWRCVSGPKPGRCTRPQCDRRAACSSRQAHPGGTVRPMTAASTARRAQPTYSWWVVVIPQWHAAATAA